MQPLRCWAAPKLLSQKGTANPEYPATAFISECYSWLHYRAENLLEKKKLLIAWILPERAHAGRLPTQTVLSITNAITCNSPSHLGLHEKKVAAKWRALTAPNSTIINVSCLTLRGLSRQWIFTVLLNKAAYLRGWDTAYRRPKILLPLLKLCQLFFTLLASIQQFHPLSFASKANKFWGPTDTTAAPAYRQLFTDDPNQSQDRKDSLCVKLRVIHMLLTTQRLANMRISQGLSYVSLVLRLLWHAHKDVRRKHAYKPKSHSWPPSSRYPPLITCLWAGRAACILMACPLWHQMQVGVWEVCGSEIQCRTLLTHWLAACVLPSEYRTLTPSLAWFQSWIWIGGCLGPRIQRLGSPLQLHQASCDHPAWGYVVVLM